MSTTTIKLWYVSETSKARRYCKLPLSRNPTDSDYLYVPLSIIEHTTKWAPLKDDKGRLVGCERWCHEVTLPDWFIEKEKL